jgi:hypothetical protein
MKNIDQYYVFKYNQQYRLEHQAYYRDYCREYNFRHKEELKAYRETYYKNKKLMKKMNTPIMEIKQENTTIYFS